MKSRKSKSSLTKRGSSKRKHKAKIGRRTHLPADPNDRREKALELMKKGVSQEEAARTVGISAKTLARYRKKYTTSKLRHRKWNILDRRPANMLIASRGIVFAITVPYRSKTLVGKYWSAVNKFLDSNNVKYLRQFRDVVIRDIQRKRYVLETDPNALRRSDSVGELSFHTLYKNTAN